MSLPDVNNPTVTISQSLANQVANLLLALPNSSHTYELAVQFQKQMTPVVVAEVVTALTATEPVVQETVQATANPISNTDSAPRISEPVRKGRKIIPDDALTPAQLKTRLANRAKALRLKERQAKASTEAQA